MTIHTIEPETGALHGKFSRELAPVLVIDPGDTVRYRTLDAGWNLTPPTEQDQHKWNRFRDRDPERDVGHALSGPLAIRGAKSGMMLAVEINEIIVGTWGWNVGADWFGVEDAARGQYPVEFYFWTIDRTTSTARNQLGQVVPVRPFMGVMGMPPDEAGWHSTGPPRLCGGNIDCKELLAGSTLYLPIAVDDALFSVGDGHAVQADGEISGTAIECPMERVELTFDLPSDSMLKTPHANTPAGWITFGFEVDLNKAYESAMWAMIELMTTLHGITRLNAISLASLIVEMRITQRVNGVNGVHALLPHGAYQRLAV